MTWIILKCTVLSERSQTPKSTYYMSLFMWHFRKDKTIATENRLVIAEVWREGNWLQRGTGELCGWQKCLYLYWGGSWASQVALVVKTLPANAGDKTEAGSILGLGRSPGGRHGNPLQYSCIEYPMSRGGWQATVHGVTKSWTWLKWLSIHAGYWAGVLNRDSTGPLAACTMRQMSFAGLLGVLTECYRS